jgi:hypothetical protein
LVGYKEFGGAVPDEGEVVVAGMEGFEEGRGGGKEGDVLDVWVVLLMNLLVVAWGKKEVVGLTGWFVIK